MSDQEILVDKTETVTGSVKFGIGQISQDNTPKWATWAFRIYLYAASFATYVITSMSHKRLSADLALEIIGYIAISTVGVHGLSKMFGIDISGDENNANSVFTKK